MDRFGKCEICGKNFVYRSRTHSKYCWQCAEIRKKEQSRASALAKVRICEFCGKEFHSETERRCCSDECSYHMSVATRDQNKAYHKKTGPKPKTVKPDVTVQEIQRHNKELGLKPYDYGKTMIMLGLV